MVKHNKRNVPNPTGMQHLCQMYVCSKNLIFLYFSDPDAPETSHLQNLMVFVKVHPIKIQFTKNINLGLYLVPMILSFAATYVIVALQINHVI